MTTASTEMIRSSDGVEIAVHDLGGTGPLLVIAHATGFHSIAYVPLASVLTATFHCIGFDQRGHGDSSKPPGEVLDWSGFADDALAVIDCYRPAGDGREAQVLGFGHSAGGAALLLAEEARPGILAGLYCYEPVVLPAGYLDLPGVDKDGVQRKADGARRRREVFDSASEALANFSSKLPMSRFDPESLRFYVEGGLESVGDGTVRLKCRGEDEARAYEGAALHGAYEGLHGIDAPVIFACGDYPGSFGPEHARDLASQVRGSKVEVFEGLGHFGPFEEPRRVGESVLANLGGLVDGPRVD